MNIRKSGNPLGSWCLDQVKDAKTLIVLGGVLWTGINLHFTRGAIVDRLVSDQTQLREDLDKNTAGLQRVNQRISTEVVSKDEFKQYTTQLNFSLTNLATGQQQLYNLIVLQYGNRGPAPVIMQTAPMGRR